MGNLAENFVVEKKLIADLIVDDFKSIGLKDYGVEIHLDELSKKEILSFIDEVNFNRQRYLEQDYKNFKNYIAWDKKLVILISQDDQSYQYSQLIIQISI